MNKIELTTNLKIGFLRGVGLAIGLMTTSLFAAAAAMKIFNPGDTLSASAVNRNFNIAAPEGFIGAFYLNECPEGWAPADGTNGTPDLRGYFIRGRDNVGTGAAGNDPSGGRSIGNLQLDAFQGHWHDIDAGASAGGTEYVFASAGSAGIKNSANAAVTNSRAVAPITDGTNGIPRTSTETRPKNVALTYCMRKN